MALLSVAENDDIAFLSPYHIKPKENKMNEAAASYIMWGLIALGVFIFSGCQVIAGAIKKAVMHGR